MISGWDDATYLESLKSPLREKGSVFVTFSEINRIAANNASFSVPIMYYADGSNVFTIDRASQGAADAVATLEENVSLPGWSTFAYPEEELPAPNHYFIITEDLVKDNNPVSVVVSLSSPATFQGLTLVFNNNWRACSYPADLDVDTDTGIHLEIRNNSAYKVMLDAAFTNVSTITIKAIRMVDSSDMRLRISSIMFGKDIVFDGESLTRVAYTDYNDCTGSDLPRRTLEVSILDINGDYDVDNPGSFINFLEEGQPIDVELQYKPLNYFTRYTYLRGFRLESWSMRDHVLNLVATDYFNFLYDVIYEAGNILEPSVSGEVQARSYWDLARLVIFAAQGNLSASQVPSEMQNLKTYRPLPIAPAKELIQMIASATGYIPKLQMDNSAPFVFEISSLISANVNNFTYEKSDIVGEIVKDKSEKVKDITVKYYPFLGYTDDNTIEVGTFTVEDGEIVRIDHRDYWYKINGWANIYLDGEIRDADLSTQSIYFTDIIFPTGGTYKVTFVNAIVYNFGEGEYKLTLNSVGKSIVWDNPLIDNLEAAQGCAERLAVYYGSHVDYDYPTRGYPFIEAGDVIYQENEYIPDLTVTVTEQTFEVDQAYSGNAKTRRAVT